ncbi:MAG: SMC-Scp complex subunit ScpB [Verrucomicrobia bacterium]|nr:SMC-Scp complex subunit ScpB [Verrucomicrobiota bacterium]
MHGTKSIVEALLFATSEPLSIQKIQQIITPTTPATGREIKKILLELQNEYIEQNRSFGLENIAEGYLLRTKADFAPYVQLLFNNRRKDKLSQASLETLAIIAYKQPVTKAQIEAIRGVDSSGVLAHLQERLLIEVTGRAQTPGRPSLFATTKEFLKHFGLKNLSDLPPFQSGA